MKKFINKNYTYAIVGASNDESKYGHKVFMDLKENGFKVVPINPNSSEVAGEKSYAGLKVAPVGIDVAVFVVPPAVTEKVLLDAKAAGIRKIWLQPGSESGGAIRFCEENGMECMHDACIMLSKNNRI